MVQPPYEKSVFINCPYDGEYEPLFNSIVFTVAALGFTPRSARDTEGFADTRIVRITSALTQSKYSIHDLSRFTGEGLDNFARFNMPLELGVALALRHERQNTAKPHNFLVLVTGAYEYQKFVSDLAGFDPCRHESTVRSVVREVRVGFSSRRTWCALFLLLQRFSPHLQSLNWNLPSVGARLWIS